MHTLKVTLRQHTPLIHFQHDQDGATLRASEVKPKLDRYILGKLTEEDKNLGKQEGWIKTKNGRDWLNYWPRITAYSPINIKMIEQFKCIDETGQPLYETTPFPDKKTRLVLGNMGGKTKNQIQNFIQHETVDIEFRSDSEKLLDCIKAHVPSFFMEHNFHNRANRGFGSFSIVEKQRGNDIVPGNLCATVSFSIQCSNGYQISDWKGTECVFKIIGMIWNKLVQNRNNKTKGLRKVFLGVKSSLKDNEERIPSPIYFKPIIEKDKKKWDVKIYILYNMDVIAIGGSITKDFKSVIISEKGILFSVQRQISWPNFSIQNFKILI